jgi:putative membrane protein insertion efficiency factor
MRHLLNILLIGMVRFYRWILSPLKNVLFGPLGRCRFDPTCSAYALEALRRHGPFRGSWLAIKRIGRCHPWGGCGHDPVPGPPSGTSPGSASSMKSSRTPFATVSH